MLVLRTSYAWYNGFVQVCLESTKATAALLCRWGERASAALLIWSDLIGDRMRWDEMRWAELSWAELSWAELSGVWFVPFSIYYWYFVPGTRYFVRYDLIPFLLKYVWYGYYWCCISLSSDQFVSTCGRGTTDAVSRSVLINLLYSFSIPTQISKIHSLIYFPTHEKQI